MVTKKELQTLYKQLVLEMVLLKTAHTELGNAINDMRGQIDTIFGSAGLPMGDNTYTYEGFKAKKK